MDHLIIGRIEALDTQPRRLGATMEVRPSQAPDLPRNLAHGRALMTRLLAWLQAQDPAVQYEGTWDATTQQVLTWCAELKAMRLGSQDAIPHAQEG